MFSKRPARRAIISTDFLPFDKSSKYLFSINSNQCNERETNQNADNKQYKEVLTHHPQKKKEKKETGHECLTTVAKDEC